MKQAPRLHLSSTVEQKSMHTSAMENARAFFDAYAPSFAGRNHVRVVDIGAQDVNGSLRSVMPPQFEYVGVDFVAGRGVDIVLDDPYHLPIDDASCDIVLSSSCFEHSEMFWLLYLEIMRIIKPDGLFYLNVPSNGAFHRYPVDCWRFFPDAAGALVAWGKRNALNSAMLESFISAQVRSASADAMWNDFVAVFLKDATHLSSFPRRILDSKTDYFNGFVHGDETIRRQSFYSEDQLRLNALANELKAARA